MSEEKGRKVTLLGRVVLTGQVRAVTGLHIGASKDAFEIGGVDMPVVRNPVDRTPYIPGSSLKGKMRSLWEKVNPVRFNFQIGKSSDEAKQVWIHMCDAPGCPVCSIYGTTGDSSKDAPARLMVRDIPLAKTSLPETVVDYTEVKWEAAIDRVTSAATPRQMERVPAGAVFEPLELVFSFYGADDVKRFIDVLTALQLVEDDFLGGQGSRGSGKVRFEDLALTLRVGVDYQTIEDERFKGLSVSDLQQQKSAIQRWLQEKLTLGGA